MKHRIPARARKFAWLTVTSYCQCWEEWRERLSEGEQLPLDHLRIIISAAKQTDPDEWPWLILGESRAMTIKELQAAGMPIDGKIYSTLKQRFMTILCQKLLNENLWIPKNTKTK